MTSEMTYNRNEMTEKEEKCFEGIMAFWYWFTLLAILCTAFYVLIVPGLAHAARVPTYGHDTCDTSCTPTYGGGYNCSTTC